MDVKETLNKGLKREFTVAIPGEKYSSLYQKRLADIAKNMDIRGFRKGKVPLTIAQQRYGKHLQAEIMQDLLKDSVEKIFKEKDIHAVTQPKLMPIMMENPEKEIKFSVSTEVAPEIALPDLTKISVERLTASVDKTAIKNVLDNMAQRSRSFEPLKVKRASKKGDVVCVDFLGKENGVPFEGGKGENVNIELGSNHFIPGFEEQIEGMKPGEEKTIKVTFPENYRAAKLAGKEVTFDVKVISLQKAVTPKIDEEFAKKLGYKDVASLEDFIRKNLEGEYKHVSDFRLQRSLLDKLAAIKDFELPETLVEEEFKQIWGEVEEAKKKGQLDKEDEGKDDETLKKEYKEIVDRRIKLGLILAEIGRKDGVRVEQPDIEAAIKAEAAKYPGQSDKVVEYFSHSAQARNALVGDIYQEKVVEHILSHADVKDKKVSAKELLDVK